MSDDDEDEPIPDSGPFCEHWNDGNCFRCTVENHDLAKLIAFHPDNSPEAEQIKALARELWPGKEKLWESEP